MLCRPKPCNRAGLGGHGGDCGGVGVAWVLCYSGNLHLARLLPPTAWRPSQGSPHRHYLMIACLAGASPQASSFAYFGAIRPGRTVPPLLPSGCHRAGRALSTRGSPGVLLSLSWPRSWHVSCQLVLVAPRTDEALLQGLVLKPVHRELVGWVGDVRCVACRDRDTRAPESRVLFGSSLGRFGAAFGPVCCCRWLEAHDPQRRAGAAVAGAIT